MKAFEKRIGCGLPEEYRNFLKTYNGGHPNPDCVAVPGVEGIDNVGVGVFMHLRATKPDMDELSYEVERVKTLLPPGHLPIAGSSDLFTLSLKPKTFGCVYCFNCCSRIISLRTSTKSKSLRSSSQSWGM